MNALTLSAPLVDGPLDYFDPFDPAFRANPWPVYRRLRDEAPVHRNALGAITLARYDDCAQVLRDRRLGKDLMKSNLIRSALEAGGTPPFLGLGLGSDAKPFLLSDPPDHTRLRGLVSSAFTSATVARMRAATAGAVTELLDEIGQAGSWDAVADLGYELPLRVLGDVLGVDSPDRPQFRSWSSVIAGMLDLDFFVPPDVTREREATMTAFRDYFGELMDQREGSQGDDLVSRLLASQGEDGATLNRTEIVSICVLLMVAALETTANLVGNGMLALCRAEGAWELLRTRPELAPSAVEEILRCEPSAHEVGRVVLEELQLSDGIVLAPGETALALLGSANRDERHFPDPDRLDLERGDKSHLTFGLGIHYCLGAPLARQMAQEAFVGLARHLERIEIAIDAPQYKDGFGLRGPVALPIVSDVR
jgi:cytochrome P450